MVKPCGGVNEVKVGSNPHALDTTKPSRMGWLCCNGPEGIRTLGLRVANAALSQLSYGPILIYYTTYYSTNFLE